MPKLFISYSRQDEAFARRIARLLSEWGADVWIDVEDIPAGVNWSNAIDEGLRLCDLMLLVITTESMASKHVADEWQSYHDDQKAIVPLLLRRAPVHFQLRRMQYIDFENQPFDTAAKQLHGELVRKGIKLKPIAASDTSQRLPVQPPLPEATDHPPPMKSTTSAGGIALAVLVIGIVLAIVGLFILPMLNANNAPTLTPTGEQGVSATELSETRVAVAPTLTPTENPTTTDTPTATPTEAPTETETPTETPNADQRDVTLQALMSNLQTEQVLTQEAEARGTAAVLTATADQLSRNQTATADAWTDTPTPDDRATAAALLTATTFALQDDDRDELTNAREAELHTDLNNPDTDGDDLTDGEEVNVWQTDPKKRDTDGDSLEDGEEAVALDTNPLNVDTDQDGVRDDTDANPFMRPTPTATFTSTPTLTPLEAAYAQAAAYDYTAGNGAWTPVEHTFEDGVTMVLVPPGCFMMGSESGDGDEQPVHEQCFDEPFWIDQTEVTQADFERLGGEKANSNEFDGDQRPVETINWFEARDFCERRGARLPTEREWEYAARGPESWLYPWGGEWNENNAVWNRGNEQGTANVGSIEAGRSWAGALDMSGNVWEWVSTIFKPYPYVSDDGREDVGNSTDVRSLRGGAWINYNSPLLRAPIRIGVNPGGEGLNIGFRCVRDA